MKQIIYLRYYEGMAFDDIAEIMSIKPQVAQNFAYRALKKLRLALPLLERLLSLLPFLLWA
jgi:DNA-directed RNA polymerase specialized sigma24 family protein